MQRMRAIHLMALAGIAVVSAACEPTTAVQVTDEIDTEAALADYEAMTTAMEGAEFDGLAALEGRSPFGGSPAAIALESMTDAAAATDGHAFARSLARRLAASVEADGSGPAAGPIISGWHRGTTFVYDPETDDYTADLERTDAPETGVRFVLYEVDEEGIPILEEEAGHADLIDEGDDSAEDLALRLHVVWHDATVLDYATTLDHGAGRGALTVVGYLQGDGVRLDFDIGVDAEEREAGTHLEIAFDIGVPQRDFRIVGSFSGVEDEDDGDGTIDIEITHRTESMRFAAEGVDGVLDGTFYVNGAVFATVSGPENDLVFLDAEGNPIEWNEALVIRHAVDVVEDVFDLLEDLIDPVDELVLLGFIL